VLSKSFSILYAVLTDLFFPVDPMKKVEGYWRSFIFDIHLQTFLVRNRETKSVQTSAHINTNSNANLFHIKMIT
jgi:hypothetical protein